MFAHGLSPAREPQSTGRISLIGDSASQAVKVGEGIELAKLLAQIV
jgi:hypothetical protein